MGRPPLPVGTWGRIRRERTPSGAWVARARFRGLDGVTRDVKASGSTGAQAERRLVEALHERSRAAGEHDVRDTPVSELVEVWLAERRGAGLAAGTLARYQEAASKHVLPGVGGLRVREVTPARLHRFLQATAERSVSTARLCRVVLSGAMGVATRFGAIDANPVRDVGPLPTAKRSPRALTDAELVALREGVRQWQEGGTHGPPRAPDLLDVVDVMLGTGARIGEVLALRWSDVDLAAARPTVTIRGTVVVVKGEGVVLQEHPKSDTSRRRLVLPRFAADTLLRRRVNATPNPYDVIFPSSARPIPGLRSPSNLRRQWREARDAAGFGWVTPHTFRRTVATLLDAERTTRTAAAQLGHSDERVTLAHYVQRTHDAPDVADVLERLRGPDRAAAQDA